MNKPNSSDLPQTTDGGSETVATTNTVELKPSPVGADGSPVSGGPSLPANLDLLDAKLSNGTKPEIPPDDLRPEEFLTFCYGSETYRPGTGGEFTVGQCAVSIQLREGETARDAFARARRVTSIMFEVEFEMKRREYLERLKRLENGS